MGRQEQGIGEWREGLKEKGGSKGREYLMLPRKGKESI